MAGPRSDFGRNTTAKEETPKNPFDPAGIVLVVDEGIRDGRPTFRLKRKGKVVELNLSDCFNLIEKILLGRLRSMEELDQLFKLMNDKFPTKVSKLLFAEAAANKFEEKKASNTEYVVWLSRFDHMDYVYVKSGNSVVNFNSLLVVETLKKIVQMCFTNLEKDIGCYIDFFSKFSNLLTSVVTYFPMIVQLSSYKELEIKIYHNMGQNEFRDKAPPIFYLVNDWIMPISLTPRVKKKKETEGLAYPWGQTILRATDQRGQEWIKYLVKDSFSLYGVAFDEGDMF
ncbi:hypothetical protein Fcan01_18450 [Folsomia candida]|uniref:Uncharacterized protein n=1 Tax=Folsomia candida TaxID=158441 RepID=A0A226DNG2_FOLCA|nr:hypothetical protein Fcan01_18450 [Folsomia candida]